MHQMKSLSLFDFNIKVPVSNHHKLKKPNYQGYVPWGRSLLAPFTFTSENVHQWKCFLDNDRFLGNVKGRKERRQVTRKEPFTWHLPRIIVLGYIYMYVTFWNKKNTPKRFPRDSWVTEMMIFSAINTLENY